MFENIRLTPYFRTALKDGTLVPDAMQHMTSEFLIEAFQGDTLSLADANYMYTVAIYDLKIPDEYVYTYAYAPESNWVTYTENVTPDSYFKGKYVFDKHCYYRVCVKKEDGSDIVNSDIEKADKLIGLEKTERKYVLQKDFFETEARRVSSLIDKKAFKIILLTDSHYAVNGTWDDTANNIQDVCRMVNHDAVVHLGDLTDGMMSKERTAYVAGRMIGDMEKSGAAVYMALGNHDTNYFRNRSNVYSKEEIKKIYASNGMKKNAVFSENNRFDYYVDINEYNLRLIFIESFDDNRPVRYGYDDEQLEWFKNTLNNSKKGTRFLVFSHDAPLGKLDYWSYHINNGEKLVAILDDINSKDDYHVIGLIYGHTHADQECNDASFPMVSVCCNKMEYFTDKKPEGSRIWNRTLNTLSQECFDSLSIDFENEVLRFVRFGAGENREVSYAKKTGYASYIKNVILNRKTKIWAHRGASGHAPENTLASFELAAEMGADGIELDVQLTKDGQLIVMHDERVDRTTDGTGAIRDYTFEEIRKLNAAKNMPVYGFCQVPSLEEIYDFVKRTDMMINLELKNGIVFYPELEEKVLKLAAEKGLEDRIIYSSFNHYSMRKLKALKSDSKIAFLYSNGILDVDEYAVKNMAYAVHPSLVNVRSHEGYDETGEIFVKKCHDAGVKVHVWNANEQVDIDYLKSINVDAVITNFVERG